MSEYQVLWNSTTGRYEINFACPFCERQMKVPVEAAGKSGRCKNCKQNVLVPEPVKPVEQIPVVYQVKAEPRRYNRGLPIVILILGPIAWALCAMADESPADYLAIIGTCVGVFWLIAILRSWKIAAIVTAMTFVGWIYAYGSYDTTIERWENDNYKYTDTYLKRGHIITHRRVAVSGDDGKWESVHEGDFTGTGKQHGHWTTTLWPSLDSRDQFYWYGEPISEGEWHLRSDGQR